MPDPRALANTALSLTAVLGRSRISPASLLHGHPSTQLCSQMPLAGSCVLLGRRKSEASHLFAAWSPSQHLRLQPSLHVYHGAL